MTNDDVAATWAASNSEPHHLFAYRHAVELLRGAAPGVGRHGSSKVWDMLREAASFALSNRMALPNWRPSS